MLGLPVIASVTLDAAVKTFNDGRTVAFVFCELYTAVAYQIPTCFAGSPTLKGVLPHLLEQGDPDLQWWQELQPVAVANTFFFNTSHSMNGPALLQAVNTVGAASTPAGLYVEVPDKCEGCTKYLVALVLLYPSGTVVRLDGMRGHD